MGKRLADLNALFQPKMSVFYTEHTVKPTPHARNDHELKQSGAVPSPSQSGVATSSRFDQMPLPDPTSADDVEFWEMSHLSAIDVAANAAAGRNWCQPKGYVMLVFCLRAADSSDFNSCLVLSRLDTACLADCSKEDDVNVVDIFSHEPMPLQLVFGAIVGG